MKKAKSIKARKLEFHVFVAQALPRLRQLKEQGDRATFNEVMEKLLPGVKRYISRRLATAVSKGLVPVRKYKVEDFVGDLFIKAYDHIHEVKEDRHFHTWLFKKADELLDDAITEEEFDGAFFENIDDYGKPELDEMEEKFSTDGDGDLVMEEELDDLSYPKNDYGLKDVFVENTERGLVEKLDKELSEEEIQRHINRVMHHLPAPVRDVFDLCVNQHFEPEQTAAIKRMPVEKTKKYLAEARRLIRLSFENKYLSLKT
ncbi:MAG TPA: sigma-70 family RNA polymerase sigma factor [Bacteroidetes bacterium]|nr:sigma-70 family RNA polymerase sigma factor [Bacteroidota bacterium]